MSTQKPSQTFAQKAQGTLTGWIFLIVVYGICASTYQAWLWWDRSGYRSHTVSAQITAQAEWLPGETKTCSSSALTRDVDADNQAGDVFSYIACDEGPAHNVRIEFYGQQIQPGLSATWSCTKNAVSTFNDKAFTCKQTGAY